MEKKVRKSRVIKTRNANTMSESAFWGMISNTLRQRSRWWKPIAIVKQRARREYKGINKRQKFEYQCNYCKKWFSDKEIFVDHVIPVGSLMCANDLPGCVERLFCEEDNLQTLCSECHNKKTLNERTIKKQ